MFSLYQFNVLIIPVSKSVVASQPKISFALVQFKNKDVGIVGFDKS